MIKVLFFAKIREVLGTEGLEFDYDENYATIEDIRDEVCKEEGEVFEEVLCATNVIVSRNHKVADLATPIEDGDEIAFYPPVSGG